MAVKVVQVADQIDGTAVDGVTVHDPLGGATRDRAGAPRTAAAGDHMLTFAAATSAGTKIIRATHYDVSATQLRQVMGTNRLTAADAERFVGPLNRAMTEFGTTTPKRQAAFLAQLGGETRLVRWEENLNYTTVARLRAVFPSYFPATMPDAQVETYLNNPEGLANRVYANRLGNGDEASGDGWRFRGRGPIQLTGRSNYVRVGTALGLDLVGNPDWVSDRVNRPDVGFRVAAFFFRTQNLALGTPAGQALVQRSSLTAEELGRSLAEIADLVDPTNNALVQDVNEAITYGVNGGFHGLAARLGVYRDALAELLD
jgi:putative chitinase